MTPLQNKIYYTLKPYVPRAAVLAVRKWWARRTRPGVAGVWPIDERCKALPPGWPGWPEGKRFALVLTHDVEGTEGLGRIDRLADLETRYGFRSSFNLVPEGSYRASDEVRSGLRHRGFEVGIHGLKHDGKLYFSKSIFTAKAARIRRYVEAWGASGFRSPFMHHRIGWLHYLGIEYDSSTFDTDPFEPEPDAIGTIFPFWVAAPNGGGYVELPSTLPQDFSLFVVLGDTTIDVWKRKLDWIAAHGGMALLNTHPDYMSFDAPGRNEYPAALYAEFLDYARRTYGDMMWSPLPRDVARFYASEVPPASRASRKKVCIVTERGCDDDTELRGLKDALTGRGDHVDVLRSKSGASGRLRTAIQLTRMHSQTRYDLIHVQDGGGSSVFTAWYPHWTGARVLLETDGHSNSLASRFADRAVSATSLPEYLALVDALTVETFDDQ